MGLGSTGKNLENVEEEMSLEPRGGRKPRGKNVEEEMSLEPRGGGNSEEEMSLNSLGGTRKTADGTTAVIVGKRHN